MLVDVILDGLSTEEYAIHNHFIWKSVREGEDQGLPLKACWFWCGVQSQHSVSVLHWSRLDISQWTL